LELPALHGLRDLIPSWTFFPGSSPLARICDQAGRFSQFPPPLHKVADVAIDWAWLIGDAVIAGMLPERYASYRRPIVEALGLFLAGLPAADVAAILRDQADLPPTASAEERLSVLAEHCPALHKLGQVLARDRRLAPELRKHLQRLESLPPRTDLRQIEQTLEDALGPLKALGVELDPQPLAEASVAVVIPFHWLDARGGEPRRGVFKVLKPGIESRLDRELSLLGEVGALLDDRCASFGIPRLDYGEVFEQVRGKLAMEVNLEGEQRHLQQAADTYREEPDVQIPALYPFCASRVTAMERVDGRKVTDTQTASPAERRRLARIVVEALIAGPIWSSVPEATFHADPHAGNLFATDDGRLAILDWSLTGTFREAERVAMARILLAAMVLDQPVVTEALASLALDRRVDEPALRRVVDGWLRRVRLGQFPGFTWLMGMLDDAVVHARLRARTDLILFRKSLLTLEGVLADLAPEARIDDLILPLFLGRLIREWPGRLWANPLSRAFATRISNLDLAELLLRLPWTPLRAGLENLGEILTAVDISPRRAGDETKLLPKNS